MTTIGYGYGSEYGGWDPDDGDDDDRGCLSLLIAAACGLVVIVAFIVFAR